MKVRIDSFILQICLNLGSSTQNLSNLQLLSYCFMIFYKNYMLKDHWCWLWHQMISRSLTESSYKLQWPWFIVNGDTKWFCSSVMGLVKQLIKELFTNLTNSLLNSILINGSALVSRFHTATSWTFRYLQNYQWLCIVCWTFLNGFCTFCRS